jgi:hypothetical protein
MTSPVKATQTSPAIHAVTSVPDTCLGKHPVHPAGRARSTFARSASALMCGNGRRPTRLGEVVWLEPSRCQPPPVTTCGRPGWPGPAGGS